MTDSRTADVETAASHLLDAERQFVLPATLKEQMYVVPGHAKPLVLLHLLYTLSLRRVLCFTKSVEASNRLVQLLSFFADEHASGHKARVEAANYSSDLSPAKRREVVERFVKGDVGVLVCSDLVARGIDIPSVEHVINYDAPIDMRKYVHRVGRTARAGKEGQAWSLVETQEVCDPFHGRRGESSELIVMRQANAFKHMLKEAGRYEAVRKLKIKEAETEPFNEAYEVWSAPTTAPSQAKHFSGCSRELARCLHEGLIHRRLSRVCRWEQWSQFYSQSANITSATEVYAVLLKDPLCRLRSPNRSLLESGIPAESSA